MRLSKTHFASVVSFAALLQAAIPSSTQGAQTPATRAASRSMAVLAPVTRGSVPKDMVRAISTALERELQQAGAVITTSKVSAERLKGNAAIERCVGEPNCIGRLAATLHVDAVVHVSAERAAGGHVRYEIRVISGAGRVEREVKLGASTVAEADKAVAGAAPALARAGASGDDLALASIAKPGAKTEPAATGVKAKGGDDLELAPLVPAPGTQPADSKSPPATEINAAPAAPVNTGIVPPPNAEPIPVTPLPPPPATPARRHFVAYAGIGVAAASLALIGIGTGYIVKMRQNDDKAKKKDANGVPLMNQTAANDTNTLSAKYQRNGNTLLVVGGVTAAVAAALISVDLFWLGQPTTSVSVGSSSAAVQLGWTF